MLKKSEEMMGQEQPDRSKLPKEFIHPKMTVMEMINDGQIKSGAFNLWLRYYKKAYICSQMNPFINAKIEVSKVELPDYLSYKDHLKITPSWLRSVREAFFLSAVSLSHRMNLRRAGYSHLEKSEADGTISLNSLRKAAEAMDCELVYAIIPKDKVTPAEKIWEVLYPLACRTKFVANVNRSQRMYGIASAARMLMEDQGIRQQQGWSIRGEVSEGGVFREITRLEAKKIRRLDSDDLGR